MANGDGEQNGVAFAVPAGVIASSRAGTSRVPELGVSCLIRLATTWRPVSVVRYNSADVARRVAAVHAVPVERIQKEIEEFVDDLLPSAMIDGACRRDRWVHRLRDRFAHGLVLLVRSMKWPFRLLPTSVRLWMLMTATLLLYQTMGWARAAWIMAALYPRTISRASGSDWGLAARRIDTTVRNLAAGHWLSPGSPERAICGWALLRTEGWPADLVVGVDVFPALGRCWCQSGPWTLGDDPRMVERFFPVIRYF